MAELEVYDHATVTMREAAFFFRMGHERFRERYDREFHTKIRAVKVLRGIRLLLTDVVKVAFPDADNLSVHVIAYDFLKTGHRENSERIRAYKNKGEKK